MCVHKDVYSISYLHASHTHTHVMINHHSSQRTKIAREKRRNAGRWEKQKLTDVTLSVCCFHIISSGWWALLSCGGGACTLKSPQRTRDGPRSTLASKLGHFGPTHLAMEIYQTWKALTKPYQPTIKCQSFKRDACKWYLFQLLPPSFTRGKYIH